ncbi:DUF2911 domain-containing protein [Puniceicoccaceae bacterium K14]|nr:DUF2911 domain-containing protein [Puniceicoccaceae bacterium K14]
MKSRAKIWIFSFFAFCLGHVLVNAQERGADKVRLSPNASVSQTIGTTIVSVTYGRPSLKGRSMSALAPADKVWRTGANESAAITFSSGVEFGGQHVEVGTYSLYTIPSDTHWTFILNSTLSWGTRYDEAMDVVRATGDVSEGNSVESFTIGFDTLSADKADLVLSWGNLSVAVPITVSSE